MLCDAVLNHSNCLLPALIPFMSALTLSIKIGLWLPTIFFCEKRQSRIKTIWASLPRNEVRGPPSRNLPKHR